MKYYFLKYDHNAVERRTTCSAFETTKNFEARWPKNKNLYDFLADGNEFNIEDNFLIYNYFKSLKPITICKTLDYIIVRDTFIDSCVKDDNLFGCLIQRLKTVPEIDASILIIPTLEFNDIIDFEKVEFGEFRRMTPFLNFDPKLGKIDLSDINFRDIMHDFEKSGSDISDVDMENDNFDDLYSELIFKTCSKITFKSDIVRNYNIFKIGGLESDITIISEKFVELFKKTNQYGVLFEELTDSDEITVGVSERLTNNKVR